MGCLWSGPSKEIHLRQQNSRALQPVKAPRPNGWTRSQAGSVTISRPAVYVVQSGSPWSEQILAHTLLRARYEHGRIAARKAALGKGRDAHCKANGSIACDPV